MAINLNNKDVTNIQYGNKKVTKVYKGSTQIWPVATVTIWKDISYHWVNNGGKSCQTSTSVSGFNGYTANTGNSIQPQVMYKYQQQYQVFNDGVEEPLSNYRYMKYDDSSSTSSITSQGTATISDTTRNYTSSDPGCYNIPTWNGSWICELSGGLNTGNASQSGKYQRTSTSYGSLVDIITPGGVVFITSRTENANGCTINRQYTISTTACSVATINPSSKGYEYNGNVNNLFNGNKITTYNCGNSICSVSDKDIIASWVSTNITGDIINSTDNSYCRFTENITANICQIVNNDYNGTALKTYSYQNLQNNINSGNPIVVSNISVPATATSTPVPNCPASYIIITGMPTSNVSFNGGTYSLKISSGRAWKLQTNIGTLSVISGNAGSNISTTLTIPAQTTSGQTVSSRTITITGTPTAGIATPVKTVSCTQEGCVSSSDSTVTTISGPTCETTSNPLLFPSSTTGLVNASGSAISGTLGTGGSAINITGTNTGQQITVKQKLTRIICTAPIAGVVYNSDYQNDGDPYQEKTPNSLCDNRVVSPAYVSAYTCLTDGSSNTGQAQKILNVYRANVPNASVAYIQSGISPVTINYIYTDETNCPSSRKHIFNFINTSPQKVYIEDEDLILWGIESNSSYMMEINENKKYYFQVSERSDSDFRIYSNDPGIGYEFLINEYKAPVIPQTDYVIDTRTLYSLWDVFNVSNITIAGEKTQPTQNINCLYHINYTYANSSIKDNYKNNYANRYNTLQISNSIPCFNNNSNLNLGISTNEYGSTYILGDSSVERNDTINNVNDILYTFTNGSFSTLIRDSIGNRMRFNYSLEIIGYDANYTELYRTSLNNVIDTNEYSLSISPSKVNLYNHSYLEVYITIKINSIIGV